MRNATGERNGALEPLANLAHQGKRRKSARMSTAAGSDGDQTIRTFFNCLVSKAVVDDVMQRDAAVTMHGVIQFFARA